MPPKLQQLLNALRSGKYARSSTFWYDLETCGYSTLGLMYMLSGLGAPVRNPGGGVMYVSPEPIDIFSMYGLPAFVVRKADDMSKELVFDVESSTFKSVYTWNQVADYLEQQRMK